MKRRSAVAILVLLLAVPHTLCSQESYREFTLGGEYMVTAYSFQSPDNALGAGFEVAQWHRLADTAEWVRLRHYPSVGIKASFGFTPHSICGHRLGVAAMLRSPLASWLDWDAGIGLATFAKPRQLINNTDNVYISTLISFLINTGFVFHLPGKCNLELQLIHSSNGYLSRPNRGLNYFQLGVVLPFGGKCGEWREESGERRVESGEQREMGFAMMVGLTSSRHMLQYGLYPCYNLSFNYGAYRSPLFGYGATIDLWYNGSHTWQLPRYHDNYPVPVYVGAQVYGEGFWGPLSLKLGVGYTLLSSSRVLVLIYERLGAYYNFGDSYVGLAVNAHGGQAEFVELTYGHRFRL